VSEHAWVDILIPIFGIATGLIGVFGVYVLSRRDTRLSDLEERAADNREQIEHIAGFLSGRFNYQTRGTYPR